MRCVYWIEDEPNLLTDAREALSKVVDEVREIHDATRALEMIDAIKNAGAAIIFDLWIPPGTSPEVYRIGNTPEIGLFILEKIRANLGPDWAIFVVSGNLTQGVKRRLLMDFHIPPERIFSKPLNEKVDLLVKGIRTLFDGTAPAPSTSGASLATMTPEEGL